MCSDILDTLLDTLPPMCLMPKPFAMRLCADSIRLMRAGMIVCHLMIEASMLQEVGFC